MGEARPQLRIFVYAAGFHPDLNGSNGGGGIALEQDGEPVGQYQSLGPLAPESLEQREVGSGGAHGRLNQKKP
jgi:hypothetical protein